MKINKFHYDIFFISIFPYLIGIIGVYGKAKIIENIAGNIFLINDTLFFVALFLGSQLITIIVNIFIDFLRNLKNNNASLEYMKNNQILEINNDESQKGLLYFNQCYDIIPRITDSNSQIAVDAGNLTSIVFIFLYFVLKGDFLILFIVLPFLSLSSSIGGKFFEDKFQKTLQRLSNSRVNLIDWFKDIYIMKNDLIINWRVNSKIISFKKWLVIPAEKHKVISNYFSKINFIRNITHTLLSDLPFLLCFSVLLIYSSLGKMHLTDLIIWLGIVDYLGKANNSINSLSKTYYEKKGYLHLITQKKNKTVNYEKYTIDGFNENFKMLDGTINTITSAQGLQRITGSNGAGKSTLFNVLTGIDNNSYNWSKLAIKRVRAYLRDGLRIINRDVVLLPDKNLYENIYGPNYINVILCKNMLIDTLKNLFLNNPKILCFWIEYLETLESRFNNRDDKSFSSGEKIIIAFFRCISSWEGNVKAIFLDECETFLDIPTKSIFLETLVYLSKKHSIYYISHTVPFVNATSSSPEKILNTVVFSIGLVRMNDNITQFKIFPIRMTLSFPGEFRIEYYGNNQFVRKQIETCFNIIHNIFPKYDFIKKGIWQICIENEKYYDIKDFSSATLALAIAILNLARMVKGQSAKHAVAATGKVMIDGSIDEVEYTLEKIRYCKNLNYIKEVISCMDTRHLSQIYENSLVSA